MVMLVKLSQSPNAYPPSTFNLGDSATCESLEQAKNAPSPILFTPSGITTLCRYPFPLNAFAPIATTGYPSTSSGIVNAETFPLYLVIVAFPSPSTVYSNILTSSYGATKHSPPYVPDPLVKSGEV